MNAFAGTSAYYRCFRPGIPVTLTPFADRGVLTEDNAFAVLTAPRPSAHEGL